MPFSDVSRLCLATGPVINLASCPKYSAQGGQHRSVHARLQHTAVCPMKDHGDIHICDYLLKWDSGADPRGANGGPALGVGGCEGGARGGAPKPPIPMGPGGGGLPSPTIGAGPPPRGASGGGPPGGAGEGLFDGVLADCETHAPGVCASDRIFCNIAS